jgi:hypothetical protein
MAEQDGQQAAGGAEPGGEAPSKAEAGAGIGTGRLVAAMMAKGGAYALLSVAMWPVLAAVLTQGPPFGAGADRLAAVFGVLGAAFASAACLAFVISRPRTPDPVLRKIVGVGAVFAALLLVVQLAVSVDVIRRNLPTGPAAATAPADGPETTGTADPTDIAEPTGAGGR